MTIKFQFTAAMANFHDQILITIYLCVTLSCKGDGATVFSRSQPGPHPIGVGVSNGILWVATNLGTVLVSTTILKTSPSYEVETLIQNNSTCHLTDAPGEQLVEPVIDLRLSLKILCAVFVLIHISYCVFFKCDYKRTKAEQNQLEEKECFPTQLP